MDYKSFLARYAAASDTDPRRAAQIAGTITSLLADHAAQLDTLAIAGFGTFTTTKADEYTVQNPDGTQTLMPPAVTTRFTPGSRLRKATSPHQS